MEEFPKASDPDQEKTPQLRGLYKNINISVKALNVIIIACVLLIILLAAADMQDPGLTITFDSKGGTDVVSQNQMYGDLLEMPEPPTREGYSFTGWYIDYACDVPWNADTDIIQSDMTLYAGWQKLP